jgi:hypothetical protein
MSAKKANCMFIILPELYNPDKGYELSTMWPGAAGTYRTGFYCGHDLDLAIEWANDLNIEQGNDPEFVTDVYEAVSGIDQIHFFRV